MEPKTEVEAGQQWQAITSVHHTVNVMAVATDSRGREWVVYEYLNSYSDVYLRKVTDFLGSYTLVVPDVFRYTNIYLGNGKGLLTAAGSTYATETEARHYGSSDRTDHRILKINTTKQTVEVLS